MPEIRLGEIEEKLLATINEAHLNLPCLVELLGIFLVDIGTSIEKLKDVEVSRKIAIRTYLENPKVGSALMCMGYDILEEWLPQLTKKGEGENG